MHNLKPKTDKVFAGLRDDALALFARQLAGHMGIWQYQAPQFPGDPAGGAALWSDFINTSETYYMYQSDVDLIGAALPLLKQALQKTSFVFEVGPGSAKALLNKTVPVVSQTPAGCRYVAIESSDNVGRFAAGFVQRKTGRQSAHKVGDGFDGWAETMGQEAVAHICFGSTWSNIPGAIGQNSHLELTRMLGRATRSLRKNDLVIASVDTCMDTARLEQAYTHPAHMEFGVSALYLLAREKMVEGCFDPQQWHYTPVITQQTRQVAHCVYPVVDQQFSISGEHFSVNAGELFVMNNSYKYQPDQLVTALRTCGISATPVQQEGNPALLLIGVKD